ncbi:LIC_10190 family membrane protein [Chryseobacterium sp. FH1]|uniref:LIC_10190 family membrane protein n=1 Tax=Chryseobacterium sp. FH1 TaxID=1233951 RepID=UPI00068ADC8E|nr:hypothetical protein [Chryseobacterium sp. FH1]
MIFILLTVFSLLAINFGNGLIVRNILKIETRSFVLISFLGMMGITMFETILAFFFPLGSMIELIFITIGLLGIIWFLKSERLSLSNFKFNFWFYFFSLVILFSASFSPYLFDHQSYYVPTISYLKEFGFVKGISNLDLLLGQTSFWHIYQAGFSHFVDPFLKINAYLSILFLIYIYERKQYFLLIFLPIFLLFVQQPSPDLPILILTLIVVNESINKQESPIILYLALFAFCIKPIVFWLPLFVILNFVYQHKFNFKVLIPIVIFGSLSVVKNLWLFGFPIFPVSFVDFNLPWKPSQEILTYSSQIGLMKTYDMKYSYQQVIEFNFFDKIYHWFTIGYKSVLNVGIIVSLMIISIFTIREKNKFYYLLLICIILKTILIISFSAQYRFFIDVYLIAIFLIFKNISENNSVTIAVCLSVFISVIFTFPGFLQQFNIGKRLSDFSWSQIYKPKVSSVMNFNSDYQIGNFKFDVPKYPFEKDFFPSINIYDLKLYDYYGVFPQQMGNDYKDGLYQRKLTAEEKIQLKKIITETENYQP